MAVEDFGHGRTMGIAAEHYGLSRSESMPGLSVGMPGLVHGRTRLIYIYSFAMYRNAIGIADSIYMHI